MACNIKLVLKHGLEVLEVTAYISFIFGGWFFAIAATTYLILCTHWKWLVVLYLIWVWIIDRDICNKGGRSFKWVRNCFSWKYAKNYFSLKLEKIRGVELDPKRNYLFCCFPHGIISTGPYLSFCSGLNDFNRLFPHHIPHFLTLKQNFLLPFIRDLILVKGSCSVNAESIDYLLSIPGGGHVTALMVGGAREAYNCHPRQYKFVLKQRKGFIKLAVKTGAPLVPVISFGETDLYDQVPSPEGSVVRKIQDTVKRITGFIPLIPLGRGYTPFPRRKPITVLVGCPIEMPKIEQPTKKQIDVLHEKFIKALMQMFEVNKHRYIKNSEEVSLEIE